MFDELETRFLALKILAIQVTETYVIDILPEVLCTMLWIFYPVKLSGSYVHVTSASDANLNKNLKTKHFSADQFLAFVT